MFCPKVPLAPFLKRYRAFLNSPNPLHLHFHLPSPALHTDGCPAGNIHQEKNLLPWSLPEKRWTPDTEKKQKSTPSAGAFLRMPRQWASLSCEPVGMAKARGNEKFHEFNKLGVVVLVNKAISDRMWWLHILVGHKNWFLPDYWLRMYKSVGLEKLS